MFTYSGYSSNDVCTLLRRPRQILSRAGVLKHLDKTYPFDNRHPLYDPDQVNNLAKNLIRQDGLIALGQLAKRIPLIKACDGYSDEQDSTCPQCGGMSIVDKPGDHTEDHKMWCPKCGLLDIRK